VLRDIAAPRLRNDVEHRLVLRLTSANAAHTGLYSDAAAAVRYRRAEPRGDRASERANYFEPYWEARLAPIQQQDRIAADRLDAIPVARRGAP
jgi:hypothetical protein